MIKFERFKTDDVFKIKSDVLKGYSEDLIMKQAKFIEDYGNGFTGYFKDVPVFAAGYYKKIKTKTGNMWGIFGDISKCKKTVWKSLNLMLDICVKNDGITKLRSESLIGFEKSQRVLEHLGFIKQRRIMLNGNYYTYIRKI